MFEDFLAIVICPGAEANWCEWWIANMQRPAWHRQRELRRLELAGRCTRCLAPIRAPYGSFSTTICIAESLSRRAFRLNERCHRLSPPNSGRSELLIGPIANHHSLSTVMLDLDGWLHEQQTFFRSAWMNETTKHRTTDLMIKPRTSNGYQRHRTKKSVGGRFYRKPVCFGVTPTKKSLCKVCKVTLSGG